MRRSCRDSDGLLLEAGHAGSQRRGTQACCRSFKAAAFVQRPVQIEALKSAAYKVDLFQRELNDTFILALAQLEAKRIHDMLLLHIAHRVPEERSLAAVLAELGAPDTLLDTGGEWLWRKNLSAMFGGDGVRSAPAVRPIVGTLVDLHLHEAIAVVVKYWADGTVDGDEVPVDAAESRGLGVLV